MSELDCRVRTIRFLSLLGRNGDQTGWKEGSSKAKLQREGASN